MRGSGEGRQEQAAKEVLSYLLRHPAAADTFEGIARWRLLEEIAKRSVDSTEEAVKWLIANGFLREEKIAGGRTIYRLESEKREEAELLVKKTGAEKSRRAR